MYVIEKCPDGVRRAMTLEGLQALLDFMNSKPHRERHDDQLRDMVARKAFGLDPEIGQLYGSLRNGNIHGMSKIFCLVRAIRMGHGEKTYDDARVLRYIN